MRLIDADKLHYIHKYFVDTLKGDIVVFGKEIDKAPTVKAIPIEWIEKYLEHYKEHFNKLSDKSKETSGSGWVIDVLESMLREWEKENEVG